MPDPDDLQRPHAATSTEDDAGERIEGPEGYEQSEAALVDNAESPDLHATDRILEDEGGPQRQDHAVHGEPDHVRHTDDEGAERG
jgi:hypothetical protein